MIEISPRLFKIFAISLPMGLNFGDLVPVSSWGSKNQQCCGLILYDQSNDTHACKAMRREVA